MDGFLWQSIKDGDPRGLYLFNRHYSKYHYADGRKPVLFVGPGEKMVLLTVDGQALWVWRKMRDGGRDHQAGVNCAVFRNEGQTLSSLLVSEAEQHAWRRWPGERLYTYVKASAIRSVNPGYCFKMAGWRVCGETKVNKLVILEKLCNQ